MSQIPLDRDANSRGGGGINAHEAEGATQNYVLGAWLRLWGWSCCRFCCSCTASCWHWSDVESLLINGDTQFAGMISPVKEIKGLRMNYEPLRALMLTFMAHIQKERVRHFWKYLIPFLVRGRLKNTTFMSVQQIWSWKLQTPGDHCFQPRNSPAHKPP